MFQTIGLVSSPVVSCPKAGYINPQNTQDTDRRRKILDDRFLLIIDSTSAILSAVEQLGRQIRGDEGGNDLPKILPGSVTIPQELENGFITLTREVYPDLSTIPLDLAVDAAVFYFNRITKTPDQLLQCEIRYLIAIINIMKAIWLLRTLKATHDYQIVLNYAPINPFEEQMDRWGMIVERFFDKFEEVISFHQEFRSNGLFLTFAQ